jgi:hypothetical protein
MASERGPSIVLCKSLNGFFGILIVENAGSIIFAADPDNFFHNLRDPSGAGQNTD